MDTIIFGLLLLAGLAVVFSRKRWVGIVAWSIALVMVALLFNHYVVSVNGWGL